MSDELRAALDYYCSSIHQNLVQLSDYWRNSDIPMPQIPNRLKEFRTKFRNGKSVGDVCSYLLVTFEEYKLQIYSTTGCPGDTRRISEVSEYSILGKDGLDELTRRLSARPRDAIKFIRYLHQVDDWLKHRIAGLERHLQHLQEQVQSGKIYAQVRRIAVRAAIERSGTG
jgi:hypothetical protein